MVAPVFLELAADAYSGLGLLLLVESAGRLFVLATGAILNVFTPS